MTATQECDPQKWAAPALFPWISTYLQGKELESCQGSAVSAAALCHPPCGPILRGDSGGFDCHLLFHSRAL